MAAVEAIFLSLPQAVQRADIYETPVYIYEIGNEGYVKVTPQYDTIANCTNDKIGEIFVYSDLFLTDKGVGAMSSVEEFASAY